MEAKEVDIDFWARILESNTAEELFHTKFNGLFDRTRHIPYLVTSYYIE